MEESMQTPAVSAFSLRRADPGEGEVLFDIWWRSASASHRFLSHEELTGLAPAVRKLQLERLDTWVLCSGPEAVGFMVVSGSHVDALFIQPEWTRRGGGRLLIEHARSLQGRLTVDVNEANVSARKFYTACGFEVVGRSDTDDVGRPFPLLHLSERR
jgi:putative acetyltransferase